MSGSWMADPDAKQACGHRRCGRTTLAGGVLMCASVVVLLGGAAAFPGHVPAVIAAAFTAALAGLALMCWPHPRETVPDHVPDNWVKEFLK